MEREEEEDVNTCILSIIMPQHSPSSRVRLSDRELRSEGLTSSVMRGERWHLEMILLTESDSIMNPLLVAD